MGINWKGTPAREPRESTFCPDAYISAMSVFNSWWINVHFRYDMVRFTMLYWAGNSPICGLISLGIGINWKATPTRGSRPFVRIVSHRNVFFKLFSLRLHFGYEIVWFTILCLDCISPIFGIGGLGARVAWKWIPIIGSHECPFPDALLIAMSFLDAAGRTCVLDTRLMDFPFSF